MDLFVLDTVGNEELLRGCKTSSSKKYITDSKPTSVPESTSKQLDDDEEDYFGLPPLQNDISSIIAKTLNPASKTNAEKNDTALFFKSMNWDSEISSTTNPNHKGRIDLKALINEPRSFETPQDISISKIEKEKNISRVSDRKAKEIRKLERSKTKGANWFNMPATEITEEIENNLSILQMRSALNPKQFYKKNDLKVLPKYFQIGTVQHSPLDHFSECNTRRNKKKSMVDELLADAEFQNYTKRKYTEVMKKNERTGYKKAAKKMKRLKKGK